MENETLQRKSVAYLLERLHSHRCADAGIDTVRMHLANLVERIPDENIGPDSDVIVRQDGTLVFLVKHAKDALRFVQLFLTEQNVFVHVCFMKDSMRHQHAASDGQLPFQDFAKLYLDAIFGTAFEKKIVYKGKEVFECELCFDSPVLPNKLYISRANRIRKFFLSAPKKQVERYRYLSFFETYDYEIENVLLDRE